MTKMYMIVLFASALLVTGNSANINKHMRSFSSIKNFIDDNGITKHSGVPKFLTMAQRPLANYTHSNTEVLELNCAAAGSPAPSIHWFKNDAPAYEHDVESNELIDSNPLSFGRVISTLLITKTEDVDVYTCLARAGQASMKATSVVYSKDDSTQESERVKLYPLKPRIVVTYDIYIDTVGNNIVLPCHVKGHPKPHIKWVDNNGDNVKMDPRMKVLRSGELVISSLRWSDMGDFTCYATNVFGTEVAKTFVYPARAA